jgi:SAM-dependent methyltransferase
MPVKTSDAPARFDPQYITEDDLVDLASFTGMSTVECLERVRDYSMNEMAQAWELANPSSPAEIMDFYRSTDLYIWELVQWHASSARTPYRDALHSFVESHPPSNGFRRLFDFGCGIGTEALFLAERGYEVTAVDVDGPTFDFARHRAARRGLQTDFVASTSEIPKPEGVFDGALCFDVFEHLSDPLGAVGALVQGLRVGGILLQQATFDNYGVHPCHLEHCIERFSGLRWHINLVGLGLKSEGPLAYVKCSGLRRRIQRARYELWRTTGFWLIQVGR